LPSACHKHWQPQWCTTINVLVASWLLTLILHSFRPAIVDRELETSELDRRAFGFTQKMASKFLRREELRDTYVLCFLLCIGMEDLISRSVTARELDRRAFGLIKKVASAVLGREDMSERELDDLITRDFPEADA
jgi:hypothetical protein